MQKEKRIVRVNERGLRVGEDHQNATLTDAEVDMIRRLLDERDALIERCRNAGMEEIQIKNAIIASGLSYKKLAMKFDIGKSTVASIYKCRRRAQVPIQSRVVFYGPDGKQVSKSQFTSPVCVPEK